MSVSLLADDRAPPSSVALLAEGALLHVNTPNGSWSRTLKLLQSGLGPGGILEARFLEEGGTSAGRPMAVQVVSRKTLSWELSAFGTTYEVLSRTANVAELAVHMKPPPRSALDDALLSPMPGNA